MISLALNNPRKLIYHQTKKPHKALRVFLISVNWRVHLSLSDSKFPQVPRINFNNVVIRIVSILFLIFIFSGFFSNTLKTVPWAQTTMGITVTFIFYNFINFKARYNYLYITSFFSYFQSMVRSKCKIHQMTSSCFLLTQDLAFWLRFSNQFVNQSPRKFYAPHFLGHILVWHITFLV